MIFLNRHIAVAIATLATCVAAAPGSSQPAPHASIVTCTNPASGTTWTIDIDYAGSTVDGIPANIGAGEIYWKDPKDLRNYTLDRKTGKLTVIAASSTGGSMWFNRCKLP